MLLGLLIGVAAGLYVMQQYRAPVAALLAAPVKAVVGAVPAISQGSEWTCGPAALRAVMAHYGLDIDEDEAVRLTGNVPVVGSAPEGMIRAAQELGSFARYARLRGTADLVPFLAMGMPVIVVLDSFLHPGKQAHYCVVTRVEQGGDVRLMDPHVAGNWRRLTLKEFDARWRKYGRKALIIGRPVEE